MKLKVDPELSGRGKWAVPCHTVRRTILSLGRVKLESYVSQAGTDCCSPSVLLGVFHAWQLPLLRRPAGESWTLIEAEEVVCSGAMPQSTAPPSLRSLGGVKLFCVSLSLQSWKHRNYAHIHTHLHNYKHCVICLPGIHSYLPLRLGIAHYVHRGWVILSFLSPLIEPCEIGDFCMWAESRLEQLLTISHFRSTDSAVLHFKE